MGSLNGATPAARCFIQSPARHIACVEKQVGLRACVFWTAWLNHIYLLAKLSSQGTDGAETLRRGCNFMYDGQWDGVFRCGKVESQKGKDRGAL